jgi:hypothetical protein
MHGRLLLLRYGPGTARGHSEAHVAKRLGVSQRRYELIRRRALRRLVTVARTTDCRDTGMGAAALFTGASGAAPGDAGGSGGVLSAVAFEPDQAPAGKEDQGAVLGERAEGGEGADADTPAPGVRLPLADDPADIPYLIVLALVMAALLAWVFVKRRRAAHDPYENA